MALVHNDVIIMGCGGELRSCRASHAVCHLFFLSHLVLRYRHVSALSLSLSLPSGWFKNKKTSECSNISLARVSFANPFLFFFFCGDDDECYWGKGE